MLIQGYKLHEEIGKGGFGVVYRATTPKGLNVAIKMINKAQMRAAHLTKRVANEVEVHWQLRHPSVLELFNYFEDSTFVYLVEELCDNGNLFQYMKSHPIGYLEEAEVRGLMVEMINGLLYLHSNGIIHRDIKLSNLLLNSKYQLKIADFGLAVKMKDMNGEQKTMCGTPNYISPEIVSRLPYGLSSDVWALGCMMFTLLIGHPPFESNAVKNTLEKVSKVEYSIPDRISSEAKNLVHNLLQKDPKKRITLRAIFNHPFFSADKAEKSLQPIEFLTLPKVKKEIPAQEFDPFSTTRLKPLSQKTKHGKIEILSDGSIMVDFPAEKDLLRIIGSDLIVTNRRNNSVEKYSLNNAPAEFQKRLRYTGRFVDLVRSKTQKVVKY